MIFTNTGSAKDQLPFITEEISTIDFLIKFSGDNLTVLTSIVPDGLTTTRTFAANETEEMLRFIEAKNQNGNIYFSVNPVKDRMCKKASKSDIKEFAWLHVDIDPDENMGLQEARKQILAKLDGSALKPTVIIDSGNGFQAFWKLSDPILVKENIERLESENRRLETYFQADSCHNIDRIMRVPGTLNFPNKKKMALGRIVAEAKLIYFGDEVYSVDDFSVFGDLPESKPSKTNEEHKFEPVNEEETWGKFEELCRVDSDVRKRWEGDSIGLKDTSGSGFDMALASLLKRRGFTFSETRVILHGYIYGKGIDMGDRYFIHTWNKAGASIRRNPALTDAGNAERFAERFKDELIYVTKWKCWLHWSGIRWERVNEKISEFAVVVARGIFNELEGVSDPDKQRKISAWAIVSQSAPRLDAMVKLARGKLLIEPNLLDTDTWVLNCRNGILDLKEGKLLPHEPQKFLTSLCDVKFDPEVKCPAWINFIKEITSEDEELIQYLQRLVGYCLTGETVEQAMFIFLGPGSNGKTTFLETIKFVLGEYAVKAQADSFMKKKNERINNDIAGLAGVRLAIASEIAKGRKLDESLVKELTGGDSITARKLYSENFTFIPQFKILLGLNDVPEMEGRDNGIWRRIKLIKLDYVVPKDKIDKFLMQKLQKEASGILAWALKGCLDWQKDGLAEPEFVQTATQEYREDFDPIQLYLNQNTEEGEPENSKFWTTCSEIFEDFKMFSQATGLHEISKKVFGREMAQHGYCSTPQWINAKNCKIYKGLRITKTPTSGFSATS
jgi:P4 family phage/plasmid primase-like protien